MGSPTIVDMLSRSSAMAEGKKKNWIKKAISHPGRETEKAKRNGVSTHEQMEKDSHSSDPSVRGAGNLGLRLSGMSKHKKPSKMYEKSRDKMEG